MNISNLSYTQACSYLFPRVGHGRKWSLGPTRTLLSALGNPQHTFAVVHIGGTNGKGSVATLMFEALRLAGHRVGLYTSPHLVDATERIVVDGTPIARDAFAEWTNTLRPHIDSTGASHFEAITAMAMADFAARFVEIAVVEVGLGGRLDSTNVVDPVVTVVTNVGRDHEEFLGSDLQRVAWEKASIAKPGVPFIGGEQDPEVTHALIKRAEELGGVVHLVPTEARYRGPLGLRGPHQRRNAAIALEALRWLPEAFSVPPWAVERSFATAGVPGRFDWRGKWLLDVAHNQGGMEALSAAIAEVAPPKPIHAVVGVLKDKPLASMVATIATVVDRIWITSPPSAPADRATALGDLRGLGVPSVVVVPGFDRALEDAQAEAGTVVVTGSFYTVGDAMARLPGFPPFG